jgi:hypothetical protein
MSFWIIAYFALFGVFSLIGLWDDWSRRKPRWFLICSLFANIVVGLLFAGFWYSDCRAIFGFVAAPLFVATALWEVFQAVNDIRSEKRDQKLTEKEETLAKVVGVILAFCISLPAFIVAGISAFR